MNILSAAEIDNICTTILQRATDLQPLFKLHLELMYNYGLRVGETLQTSGIYKDSEHNLYIVMPKTGFTRKLNSDLYLQNLNITELNQINKLSYINKKALERLIKTVTPYANLRVSKKGINTHIFRHNYAKKIYNITQSVEAVNLLLQEKTLSVCYNYIASQIYF